MKLQQKGNFENKSVAYINKEKICKNFWEKLSRDNSNILGSNHVG